jgi:hypothetical protein
MFLIEPQPNGDYKIREPGHPTLTVNTKVLLDAYIRNRTDVKTLGVDGALEKWRKEENIARRKAGLPKAKQTQPLHYGTKTKAACGVERGVTGTIRQEVLWHTLNPRKVTCRFCLEAMEKK